MFRGWKICVLVLLELASLRDCRDSFANTINCMKLQALLCIRLYARQSYNLEKLNTISKLAR